MNMEGIKAKAMKGATTSRWMRWVKKKRKRKGSGYTSQKGGKTEKVQTV